MSDKFYLYEFEAMCRDFWGGAVQEMEKRPEYREVEKREAELTEFLYKKLDNHQSLSDLIDCVADFPDLQKLVVYKQAFRDCIRLLNWLGLLNLEERLGESDG